MAEKMQIGEVAELFGITAKTLRHYEEMGLVRPQRLDNGYREYGIEDIRRLQRVRQLQSLGLSLREICAVLDRHGDAELWSTVLRRLRQETDDAIGALRERQERLDELIAGQKAGALEEFLALSLEDRETGRQGDTEVRRMGEAANQTGPQMALAAVGWRDVARDGGFYETGELVALRRGLAVVYRRAEVAL
jgi:DNA-binding transcriptional MerR regulator